MKTARKKMKFTLVELIVAMAVFSILLLLMLQFFSGAQRIWNGMEKRNEIYANARIAMDLITTHLQNTYSPNGSIVFFVDDPNTESSKIYFATRTGDQFPGNGSLKFMTFQRFSENESGTNGEDQLRVAVYCDTDNDFGCFFPPYGLNPSGTSEHISTYDDAVTHLRQKFTNNKSERLKDDEYSSAIADNVTSFQIIPYKWNASSYSRETSTSAITEIPYMLEIKLSVLSPEDFARWKELPPASQDDFRRENEYTFTRTVFLGKRKAD